MYIVGSNIDTYNVQQLMRFIFKVIEEFIAMLTCADVNGSCL
jgi:hypothetical protein